MKEVVVDPFDSRRHLVCRTTGTHYVRDGREIPKPRLCSDAIDRDALATLLCTQTIFPPKTLFRDYASAGMGSRLWWSSGRDCGHRLQYRPVEDLFAAARCDGESAPLLEEFDPIDELSVEMAASGVDFSNAVLLLSEGKDSTAIALALAEMDIRVDCFTFANVDSDVEYVERLARRLGHRSHIVRYEDLKIREATLERFSRVLEPTLDQAFLSYLVLPLEELQGRTIIDGLCNDTYMGHLPTPMQWRATHLCSAVERVLSDSWQARLRDLCTHDRAWSGLPFRTFTQCQGIDSGLNHRLVERSVGGVVEYLEDIDRNWRRWGFERARALSRGRHIDTYSFAGKTVALAEMVQGRSYFPWASPRLARLYLQLDDEVRFDWPKVNKLPLREAIAKRMDYDQPKVGMRAPRAEILHANWRLVSSAMAQSRFLGQPLQSHFGSLAPDSLGLARGFLYALWESVSIR